MFPGIDLYYADPAQLITAGQHLNAPGRDLCDVWGDDISLQQTEFFDTIYSATPGGHML